MSRIKIAIANDHAGTELKDFLVSNLDGKYELFDLGTNSSSAVDYPDLAHPLSAMVENGQAVFGILICGSGNGVCMSANKHQGIRAALCWNKELGKLARLHNNANVLCLPARFIGQEEALAIALTFLETDFEGGRHFGRVEKIPV